jgi:hypothetical protein
MLLLLVLARSLFPCVFHNDYHDATRCHDCLHTAPLPTKSWRSSSGMGEPGGQYFLASMTQHDHHKACGHGLGQKLGVCQSEFK